MATTRRKGGKNKITAGQTGRGVVYVGHIPHGFYEPQMKSFFTQFGQVTRLRLSRSKKSGRSKGYAFVEFRHKDVAKVAADSMNNYLFFNSILKCELLPDEKVHPELFKGSEKKFSKPKSSALAGNRNDSVKTAVQEKRREMRQKKRQAQTAAKLAKFGIEVENVQTSKDSAVPATIKTPGGTLHVLKEDAEDAEITFKTPPGGIKSSRLLIMPATKAKSKKKVKRLGK